MCSIQGLPIIKILCLIDWVCKWFYFQEQLQMLLQMWDTIFLKGKSWPLYVISFALFTIQIKHKMMLAWGLEPGAEDGRCRRIYWNIKSPPRVPYLNDISFNDISYDYILYMTLGRKLANSPFFNYEIGNGRRRQHAVSDCPKKKTNFLFVRNLRLNYI